jgi:hypothetical protein
MRGKIYLANAFSISMVEQLLQRKPVTLRLERINTETVRLFLTSQSFISAIGHTATANALSKILGINVPANRTTITMSEGDLLIVFQLSMGRLAPGKELTEEEIIKAYNEGKAYFVLVYSPEIVEE